MVMLFASVSSFMGACFCAWILFRYISQDTGSRSASDFTLPALEEDDYKVHPVTVIIPALNEDAVLAQTIEKLFGSCTLSRFSLPTVIVVLSGSRSITHTASQQLKDQHPTLHFESYPGPPTRGGQQNYGALRATSPILLFLHADTLLPQSWDTVILDTLGKTDGPAIGAFSLSLPEPLPFRLRIMLRGANVRARYGKLPYGDQAYFLRRSTFEAVGGFPDVPIMEDVSLLRRIKLHGKGKLVISNEKVLTSPRRWVKNGMIWNTAFNQIIMLAWMCGVSPERIYVWYYGRSPEQMARVAESIKTK